VASDVLCALSQERRFLLRLRGGTNVGHQSDCERIRMISSDLTSDLSGFVSTIFLSDEDSYHYAKQMLPVSDLNSSLAEKDLQEMEDPALPALILNDSLKYARTGREYLKLVRQEASSLNITSNPSIKHVVIKKSGTYIPCKLQAAASSFSDVDSAANYWPKLSNVTANQDADMLNLGKVLADWDACHDWRVFKQRFCWLSGQLHRKRAEILRSSASRMVAVRSSWHLNDSVPILSFFLSRSDDEIWTSINTEIIELASTPVDISEARRRTQKLFALILVAPMQSFDILHALESACGSCRCCVLASIDLNSELPMPAIEVIAALDVVVAAARALRCKLDGDSALSCRHRRGPRLRRVEPKMERLMRGRWIMKGSRAQLLEDGRIAEIVGESTVLSEALVTEGRWYAAVKVLSLDSKDAFFGFCITPVPELAAQLPNLDSYLPEIGYGVRGGSDKGRRKSLPQFVVNSSLSRSGVANTGVFVRNFRAGQVLGLAIDAESRQVCRSCSSLIKIMEVSMLCRGRWSIGLMAASSAASSRTCQACAELARHTGGPCPTGGGARAPSPLWAAVVCLRRQGVDCPVSEAVNVKASATLSTIDLQNRVLCHELAQLYL
jgi:hypothetical protein